MVSKVIVTPASVRGLGNVVGEKSVDDFSTYNSALSLSDGVYTMVFDGSSLVLTVSSSMVPSGGTVTCTAVLLDENGDPIEDADIDFYFEVIE